MFSIFSDLNFLSLYSDRRLVPTYLNKFKNSEVTTPFSLRQKMIDLVPDDFWKNPNVTIFEPCCGKGGFVIDVIQRLMEGLKEIFPEEKKRKKHILEKCLFFCDINPVNVRIVRKLIDIKNEFKLNSFCCDTLKTDIPTKFNISGFDLVIGNPPYNGQNGLKISKPIYQHFVKKVFENNWLKENGYLVYVHPPSWRKPNTKRCRYYGLFDLLAKDNSMIFLSIHDKYDGIKVFNCEVRFDYYLVQKTKEKRKTKIIDLDRKIHHIDLTKYDWLSNGRFDLINEWFSKDNNTEIIRSSIGDYRSKTISQTKNDEFYVPLVYIVTKEKIKLFYGNSKENTYIGKKKVIMCRISWVNAVNDFKGEYGMSRYSWAFPIENEEQGKKIVSFFHTNKKLLIRYFIWGHYGSDFTAVSKLKKDFYSSKSSNESLT